MRRWGWWRLYLFHESFSLGFWHINALPFWAWEQDALGAN
jgi:hypothetical protein